MGFSIITPFKKGKVLKIKSGFRTKKSAMNFNKKLKPVGGKTKIVSSRKLKRTSMKDIFKFK